MEVTTRVSQTSSPINRGVITNNCAKRWRVTAQPIAARDSTLYTWSDVAHMGPEAASHTVLRCDLA
jgi:hypothetical protein